MVPTCSNIKTKNKIIIKPSVNNKKIKKYIKMTKLRKIKNNNMKKYKKVLHDFYFLLSYYSII